MSLVLWMLADATSMKGFPAASPLRGTDGVYGEARSCGGSASVKQYLEGDRFDGAED